jgi:hypothetical protein
MVGRVRVRGQGPVRRGQTTTTFKKGGRVKLMHGGRPSARTRHIENEKEEIRRVDRNIRRNEGYKTGGRVKKQLGGAMPGAGAAGVQRPLAAGAARPLAAGVQRPLAAGAAGVQRPLGGGYKTGGRVKKAAGGIAGAKKMARTLAKHVKDSRKKLNVHQDPSSGLSAALRHMRDNPPKKKSRSPHTETKKRTLREDYHKHLLKRPRKPRAKGIPTPALGPGGAGRRKKATGGEAKRTTPRMMGRTMPKSPIARGKKLIHADTDFHKRKRAAEKDKGKPNTPGEKRRAMRGMYSAGQARNVKTFRGDFDVGKQLRKKRKHHS